MKKIKAIFFGRSDCAFSTEACLFLKKNGFEILEFYSSKRGIFDNKKIAWGNWDFIFSFRNTKIIPESILNKTKLENINFHPGPPEYPGSGCINFALFNKEKTFGVTAHHMNKKVDDGPIIKIDKFDILFTDDVDSLLQKTHIKLLNLFIDVITKILIDKSSASKLNHFENKTWTGKRKKITEIDKLSIIDVSISQEELKQRIRSFHTEQYPLKLYIHGSEFQLKKLNYKND